MTLDEQLLADVEQARAALEAMEEALFHTRARFHQSIRRLHAAGGSMREVATALGMSHQRVHQIVGEADIAEVDAAPMTTHPAVTETSEEDRCSFCGAPRREVAKLFAGAGPVSVCDACVVRGRDELATVEVRACSFCSSRSASTFAENDAAICESCLATCERLMDDPDAPRRRIRRDRTTRCSFCNLGQGDAKRMIAGPEVYICGACVAAAVKAIKTSGPVTTSRVTLRLVSDVAAPCSFCGKLRTKALPQVHAGRARICKECIRLCVEIVAEGEEPPGS